MGNGVRPRGGFLRRLTQITVLRGGALWGRAPLARAVEASQGFQKSGTQGTWASFGVGGCQQETEGGLRRLA